MSEGGEDFNVPRDENVKAEQDLGLGELSLDVEKELERRPLMKDVGCGRDQPIRRAARQRPISRAEEAEPEKRPFLTTRKGMFGMEEYLRCAAPHGPKLRGFSFMPTKHLKGLSGEWPTDQPINSTNIYFLRGLGVTFFYQSQMSKARALLLKVSECESGEDLDIALMLAECACALPGEEWETLTDALERLCECVEGSCAFTAQFIDDWDKKLIKNGRFMGYIILQYALHQKFHYDSNEILKRPSFAFIKNVTKRLEEVSEDVQKKPHEQLIAAIQTFINAMIECRVGFPPDCRTSAYVEALCFNINAWSLLCEGEYQAAHDSANGGLHIMEDRYRGDENERAVYGDLHLNKGAALDRLGQHEKARIEFDQAVKIYETRVKDHPDEIRKGKIIANAKSCSSDTTLRSYDII